MSALEHTSERVHLLRACQHGAVQWSPVPLVTQLAPWVLDGVRLTATDPRVSALDELARRSLTHEYDSQEITEAGAVLLEEWSR